MESFKFVVDPNKNCAEQFKNFLKLDVITVIQYYCLRKLLSDNNVNSFDDYYINCTQFKLRKDCELDSSPMFYALCNKYIDLHEREDSFYKYYISWEKLIDKFKEILLTDKFDDIINNHVINEYNSLYTRVERIYFQYITKISTRLFDGFRHFHHSKEYRNEIELNEYIDRQTNSTMRNCMYMFNIFDDISCDLIIGLFGKVLEQQQKKHEYFTPVVYHDTCISSLVNEYTNHVINNGNNIDNTMSEHIVYTSDLEVTKQVIRNNQKIIANIVKNLKKETSDEVSNSNKQKLMQLLTSEEIKPEVKPKQRTKITL